MAPPRLVLSQDDNSQHSSASSSTDSKSSSSSSPASSTLVASTQPACLGEKLYINVTIHNHTEAVKRNVGHKIEQSNLPYPLKKLAHKTAPKLASEYLATSTKTATKLSQELSYKMPKQLWKQQGIVAQVNLVYQQGPYVVLEFGIDQIHVSKLLQHKVNKTIQQDEQSYNSDTTTSSPTSSSDDDDSVRNSDDVIEVPNATMSDAWHDFVAALCQVRDVYWYRTKGSSPSISTAMTVLGLRWILLLWMMAGAVMGSKRQLYIEQVWLPQFLMRSSNHKFQQTLQEMIGQKMVHKQLVANAVVLHQSQQANYFYAHVQHVMDGSTGTGMAVGAILAPREAIEAGSGASSKTSSQQSEGSRLPPSGPLASLRWTKRKHN